MGLVEWIDFAPHLDGRGALVAIEGGCSIPFDIRRVYYFYGLNPTLRRGEHAHRWLQQVAVCLAGHCRFVLDDGTRREEAILDRPNRGLLIHEMVWHEMDSFSADCALMVLASEHYDEQDYIRDRAKFLATVAKR
jgi:dTDP-4-dehydrorhamnose 3,5-epimerase-like enzyme